MKKLCVALMLVVSLVPSVGWAQCSPPTLSGPTYARVGEEYCLEGSFYYSAFAGPPNTTPSYYVDWGDGTSTGWSRVGQTNCFPHVWVNLGTYTIKAKINIRGGGFPPQPCTSDWSNPLVVTVQSPSDIQVSTPHICYLGSWENCMDLEILLETGNTYSIIINNNVDFENEGSGHYNEIYIDWGDGTYSDWFIPPERLIYPSSVPDPFPPYLVYRVWTAPGVYPIRVKARDPSTHNESEWSNTLNVSVQFPSNIIGAWEGPTGIVSGVSIIYGWAIHPQGIAKVELYIDDQYIVRIPYGGSRPDIKAAYPDYPDAEYSGFIIEHNFSESPNIKIRIYDVDGQIKDLTPPTYSVRKFHGDSVENMVPSQWWHRLVNITVNGVAKRYNILIEWSNEFQGFKIKDIIQTGR